ncbi:MULTISPECIES: tRNA pseudouridine(55) synthase TruB [Acidithiobacillus]|uniref:tRNA pseudouridine synthase B n=3 Tax=Acidithiobacillus TaxID=119977 RepID=A0A179BD25_ACIFR|nr:MULTISPECIES: tRNA pseudouridine(55) synthase TruB [Acidithiobacillus]MEB8487557.1 tRNA pseudouridine(55) synthase TruB [Acidithiobacillus ferriphilus]MEB8490576.1 tRNA pseudouridine(55) synthase TruB [Acidithiobacillus ferriphilus]MEB8492256.1 tRNA pseudouridine(55) synthase TruB [Acidithiobacillus ferriphilus]MEB8513826.1 tRNA pseudouridine(55) synthase TruB [Acidithiobacillus ferriphilus]MEB8521790.1 tRNA pseudouridine(55) synthase TruB [Acidithiobacillus ferriphilus]
MNCQHGLLLFDKPAGLTSNAALQRVKRLLGIKKAGHTGSLDPVATGLLVLLFGEATKVSDYILNADKSYRATLRLGQTTTTGDSEGEILEERPVVVSEEQVRMILPQFSGVIAQVPPMYSAIKQGGKPLYELARKGLEVERAARQVRIDALDLVLLDGDRLVLDVRCSKGTYIRSLAADIGAALGCGAHVNGLRRTSTGPFDITQALTLEALADVLGREECPLKAMDLALEYLPAVTLTENTAYYLRQGQGVVVAHTPASLGRIRLYGPMGQFLGLGEVMDDGKVAPRRLMSVN